LCRLHRLNEARATLALLPAASPFAAAVKDECGSAQPKDQGRASAGAE